MCNDLHGKENLPTHNPTLVSDQITPINYQALLKITMDGISTITPETYAEDFSLASMNSLDADDSGGPHETNKMESYNSQALALADAQRGCIQAMLSVAEKMDATSSAMKKMCHACEVLISTTASTPDGLNRQDSDETGTGFQAIYDVIICPFCGNN